MVSISLNYCMWSQCFGRVELEYLVAVNDGHTASSTMQNCGSQSVLPRNIVLNVTVVFCIFHRKIFSILRFSKDFAYSK